MPLNLAGADASWGPSRGFPFGSPARVGELASLGFPLPLRPQVSADTLGRPPSMTVREVLDKEVRATFLRIAIGGGCFAVFAFGGSAFHMPPWFIAPGVVGFGVAWLSTMYAHLWGLRCPKCRARLATLLLQRPGLRADPRIRSCPYCGIAFDAEVARGPAA